jgi:hypothetical protein
MEITPEKILIIVCGLFLILYISSFSNLNSLENDIQNKLPVIIEDSINNPIIRLLIFAYIIYHATTDFTSAIIMTAMFLLIIHMINKQKVSTKLEAFENNKFTVDDLLNILPIVLKEIKFADISLNKTLEGKQNIITIKMNSDSEYAPETITSVILQIFIAFNLSSNLIFRIEPYQAKPAVAMPAKPAVAMPAKPAVAMPAKPAVAMPAKPAAMQAKAAVAMPAKPAAMPAKPAVAMPAKPAAMPAKPAAMPAKAAAMPAKPAAMQAKPVATPIPSNSVSPQGKTIPITSITPEVTLKGPGIMFTSDNINQLNINYLVFELNGIDYAIQNVNVNNPLVTKTNNKILIDTSDGTQFSKALNKSQFNIPKVLLMQTIDGNKFPKMKVLEYGTKPKIDNFIIPKNTQITIKDKDKSQVWKLNEVNPKLSSINLKLFNN